MGGVVTGTRGGGSEKWKDSPLSVLEVYPRMSSSRGQILVVLTFISIFVEERP